MADLVHNQALGKMAEWGDRINNNDPTNSAFIVIVFSSTATDATIKDLDDVAALEADANTAEVTNTGYSRQTIDDTGSMTVTVDDGNDRVDVDMPDITWTGVAAGDNWTDLEIAYDSDTTGGTDANVVTGTWHDLPVTPDGSDITAQFNSQGFYTAS